MDLADLFRELTKAVPQAERDRENPALLRALGELKASGGQQTNMISKYLEEIGIDKAQTAKVLGTLANQISSGLADSLDGIMKNFGGALSEYGEQGSESNRKVSEFISAMRQVAPTAAGSAITGVLKNKVSEMGAVYDATRSYTGLSGIADMTRRGGGLELGGMADSANIDDTFRTEMRMAARSANVAQLALGVSESKSRDDVADIMMASFGTLSRKLEDAQIDVSESRRAGGLQAVAGPAAIMAAASGAGVDDVRRNQIISKITRELGGNMQDVANTFVRFSKDMSATGVTADEFSGIVADVSDDLSGYSNQFDSVSNQFGRFMRAVNETDPGKVSAAASAFRNIMQQVTNFATSSGTMANRAFIGGQMGMGGSALTNALEIEESMASGDKTKLEELNRRIVEEVEARTGNKLLTRQEALQTAGGAETREAQRQMLAAMYGGNEISSRDFDFFARGQRGLQDVTGPSEITAADTAKVFDVALARTELTEGPAKVAENMVSAVNTALNNGLAAMQADLEGGLTDMFRAGRTAIAEQIVGAKTMSDSAGTEDAIKIAKDWVSRQVGGPASTAATAVLEAEGTTRGLLKAGVESEAPVASLLPQGVAAEQSAAGVALGSISAGTAATGIGGIAPVADSATADVTVLSAAVKDMVAAVSGLTADLRQTGAAGAKQQITITLDRAALQELFRNGIVNATQ